MKVDPVPVKAASCGGRLRTGTGQRPVNIWLYVTDRLRVIYHLLLHTYLYNLSSLTTIHYL